MTSGDDQIPSFVVRDCSGVFVTPLLFLFNLILSTTSFPDVWKTTRVCPILKNGNPADIKNYRPIAILSNFAKVFEMSLYTHVFNAVKTLISPNQHGFFPKRSTITNLAEFTQYVANYMDNKGQIDVVYTDFSKAFDKVDHTILTNKLGQYGLSINLIQLIKSYLSRRNLYVSYNGFKSTTFLATSGVPQGSNLGPLLFILFVNDLSLSLKPNHLFFADDLKLFLNISGKEDCLLLQNQLNFVGEWCKENQLPININKCKVCSFTLKKQPIMFDYMLDSVSLIRCFEIKDLGVTYDAKMSFANHMESIIKSAYKTLGFIIRNSTSFNNAAALKSLYYSLVRSKLEYCSIIWYPLYQTHINDLEKIQRRFLKILTFRVDRYYPHRGFDHKLLLLNFNMHSLHVRRICASLSTMFKIFHDDIDSPILLSLFNLRVPRLGSRGDDVFYCGNARTNVLIKSPIYTMSNNFNQISSLCDIFCCSLSHLLSVATNYFDT